MIRVGLSRTEPHYEGIAPPYGPGKVYPELERLLAESGDTGSQNHVYAAVRGALAALGLDAARFGTDDWNPLASLVRPGARVVLKPNFIRHWNPHRTGSIASVVTHGSILRAVADYAFLAVGPAGSVAIVSEVNNHARQRGWPVEELLSVTVLAPSATIAEALSTAFFVLGLEKTLEYCDNHPHVSCLLIPPPHRGRVLTPINCGLPDDVLFLETTAAPPSQ